MSGPAPRGRAAPGRRPTMNRDEILAVVTKYVAEAADGVSPSAIDPARSMKDYGLCSLDVIEVVSRSAGQLRVTVPRAGLRKISTISGLVDLLYRSAAA